MQNQETFGGGGEIVPRSRKFARDNNFARSEAVTRLETCTRSDEVCKFQKAFNK